MECLHFDIWKWYIWFIWYIGWIVWCFSCVHSQLLLKGVFAEHHPGSDVPLYAFMCSSHLKNAMSGRQFYPNLLCYVNSLKFKSSTCWSQQWIFFQWAENNPLLSNHCLPSWVSSLTYQLFWNEWRFIQFSMQQYMLLLHCHFAHSMMVVFLLWSTTISELNEILLFGDFVRKKRWKRGLQNMRKMDFARQGALLSGRQFNKIRAKSSRGETIKVVLDLVHLKWTSR